MHQFYEGIVWVSRRHTTKRKTSEEVDWQHHGLDSTVSVRSCSAVTKIKTAFRATIRLYLARISKQKDKKKKKEEEETIVQVWSGWSSSSS